MNLTDEAHPGAAWGAQDPLTPNPLPANWSGDSFDERYKAMVRDLIKPGHEFDLDADQVEMLIDGMSICGEAGEIVDAIKKHCAYGKLLDRENLIEEIGDLMFYLTHLCQILGISIDVCRFRNMAKLAKRYPSGRYSNSQAIARADKQPETAP